MNTLSVCLIAKNEEVVIKRVLECAKTFADEIIVVDTGSNDKTKEIAKEFTEHVYDYEWNDDFAAARNFSFDKATMDYIMWLDCDDIINEENQKKIIAEKNNGFNADIIMGKYRISSDTANTVVRMVKRGTAHWEGFIHEYLARNDNTTTNCTIDFEVIHSKPESSVSRDAGRNLRIFERKKAENIPFNTRDILYYAKELYWNNRIQDSLVQIERYFQCEQRWVEDDIQLSLIEAKSLSLLGRNEASLAVLASAIVNYGMNIRLVYDAAMLCYRMGKYNEAIMYYTAIIYNNCHNSQYFYDSYDFIFHSLVWTSCAYWYAGKKEIGKKFHEKAKELQPDNEIVVNNNKFFE